MELRERARKLTLLGYAEARKKPFLHFKVIQRTSKGKEYEILFFADMRVKKYPYQQVPVCFAFASSSNEDVPHWLMNRIEREMLEELFEVGIETDSHHNFTLYKKIVRDGFCKLCSVDFEDDGALCSECSKERVNEELQKTLANLKELYDNLPISCEKCEVKLTDKQDLLRQFVEFDIGQVEKLIRHHVSYDPEIVIPVCRPCHAKIHLVKSPEYSEFQPVDKPRKIRKTVDLNCEICGKQFRVKKENSDSGPHYCSDCNREWDFLMNQRIRAEQRAVPKGPPSKTMHRALSAKQPNIASPERAILNVGIDDEYAYWSLIFNIATSAQEKKRDLVKNRILLIYGFESKFNEVFNYYKTKKEVAYRIKDDLEWYRSNDIEVKLNFNPEPDRE